MAITERTKAGLAREAFETHLNNHDVAALREFWTDETYERFPDAECHGAGEIAAYFETVFAAVPDFRMDVVNIAESGDDVYVHWHMTGTHRGPFQGMDGTGKRVAIDGMDHFVIRDDKVVSNFVVFDRMQFAQQLGALPPDGSAPDRAMKALFNLKTKLAGKLGRRT